MKYSELNDIIQSKVNEIKDSSEMKEFLLFVLENELQNLNLARGRYSEKYLQKASNLSGKE